MEWCLTSHSGLHPPLYVGIFLSFFFFSVMLGIEPMISCILGKGSSTELHPRPQTARHSMTSVNVGTYHEEVLSSLRFEGKCAWLEGTHII